MFGRIVKPAVAAAMVWSFVLFASTAQAGGDCPNTVCEPEFSEDCTTCPQDCGECPPLESTTTLPGGTTTTLPGATTTTLVENTTTTVPPTTTSSTTTSTTSSTTTSTLGATTTTTLDTCGNETCEETETCLSCPFDCGNCTTTTIDSGSTTTLAPVGACCSLLGVCADLTESACDGNWQGDDTDCSKIICPGPTTSTISTPSSTLPDPTGACCAAGGCTETEQIDCFGAWHEGELCSEPGICIDCGNSCIDFGETCDDGDSESDDGCSSTCQEEACYTCNEILGAIGNACFLGGDAEFTGISCIPICNGPSVCADDGSCDVCGDEEIGVSEDCDDGNTADGDCCDSDCQFEPVESSCTDGVFCNGPEMCDGAGNCENLDQEPDCSPFNSECAVGDCDPQTDECFGNPATLNGSSCSDEGGCVVAASGTCQNGTCVGNGTTLSPSCRWIIVAGTNADAASIQNGPGSEMDASLCGDTAKAAGSTTGSYVVTASAGTGIRFGRMAEVDGNIVTDGAAVTSTLYGKVPGTQVKTVAGGTTMAKMPSGTVDTTGTHPLANTCFVDKGELVDAVPILDAMPTTMPLGPIKVKAHSGFPIDVTGDGIAVVETALLKVGHGGSLTITGGPTDVVMIRILTGRLFFGYGATLNLTGGIKEENVLFYSKWRICRLAPGASGGGTVFCPNAPKYVVGSGVDWAGTFLGGTEQVRVRKRALLTHVPFLGF